MSVSSLKYRWNHGAYLRIKKVPKNSDILINSTQTLQQKVRIDHVYIMTVLLIKRMCEQISMYCGESEVKSDGIILENIIRDLPLIKLR